MKEVIATSVSGKYVLESRKVENVLTGAYQLYTICGTEIINEYNGRHMYNCGAEKYIRRIWNKRYDSK
jgi:hypothetical protein